MLDLAPVTETCSQAKFVPRASYRSMNAYKGNDSLGATIGAMVAAKESDDEEGQLVPHCTRSSPPES